MMYLRQNMRYGLERAVSENYSFFQKNDENKAKSILDCKPSQQTNRQAP
jgi:hypothetical protein